ncbi:MAG: alpha/beta hydrolase-fold protein [Planctomycetota bacterium]|nr:alpha/beta hydrolase-fold protein [Planctomycetota bacterium]
MRHLKSVLCRVWNAGGLLLAMTVLLWPAAGTARAEEATTPATAKPGEQVAMTYKVKLKDGKEQEIHCWTYLPKDYAAEKPLPLLLFLHGAGERGTVLKEVAKFGPPKMLRKGQQLPVIVVSPQCRKDCVWEPDELLPLVDELQRQYAVDPDRVFISGFSMGASGAWNVALADPERFAGAVPVAAGTSINNAKTLAKVRVWTFHGDVDELVSTANTAALVEAIKSHGGQAQVTVLPKLGHMSCDAVFAREDIWKWFLETERLKKKND